MSVVSKSVMSGPPAMHFDEESKSLVLPPLPSPNKYGKTEEQYKKDDYYISCLVDKPPIEYIAEFLCNIFKHRTDKVTGEYYFQDCMGRTFFETINHLFTSKSNIDKIDDLRKNFHRVLVIKKVIMLFLRVTMFQKMKCVSLLSSFIIIFKKMMICTLIILNFIIIIVQMRIRFIRMC